MKITKYNATTDRSSVVIWINPDLVIVYRYYDDLIIHHALVREAIIINGFTGIWSYQRVLYDYN